MTQPLATSVDDDGHLTSWCFACRRATRIDDTLACVEGDDWRHALQWSIEVLTAKVQSGEITHESHAQRVALRVRAHDARGGLSFPEGAPGDLSIS